MGEILGQRWSGGALNADGKVELTGFTGADLASSAKGTVHFEWRRGTMLQGAGDQDASTIRFERWTGNAEITGGKIALTENQMLEGGHARKVDGSAQLEAPVKFTFVAPKEKLEKRGAGSQ